MLIAEADADRMARDAVLRLNAQSSFPILLICEHAGHAVPEPWDTLGLDPALLRTHYGYDPGTELLTRRLAERLDAPAVLARYSRIFLDYNRYDGHWDLMRPDLGGIPVPGNLHVDAHEQALRRRIARAPVEAAIEALAAGRRALVSVHSFTPVMGGEPREVDVAVMWREETTFVRMAMAQMRTLGAAVGLRVGDNHPYDWRKVSAYSLQRHGLDRGLPCFYLEVNNALLCDERGGQAVADLVAGVLAALEQERAEWASGAEAAAL